MTPRKFLVVDVEMVASPIDIGSVISDWDRMNPIADWMCLKRGRKGGKSLFDRFTSRRIDLNKETPVSGYRVDDSVDLPCSSTELNEMLRQLPGRTSVELDEDPAVAERFDRPRLDQISIKFGS
jgi:hypothetical protein